MAIRIDGLSIDDEKKKEIIDRLAKTIIDLNMQDLAEIFFDMYGRPEIIGQMAFIEYAPLVAVLFGKDGLYASEILGLEPRVGSALILKRLRELKAEKEKEKLFRKEEPFTSKVKSWLSQVQKRFSKPE